MHIVDWNAWAARNYRPPVPLGHEIGGEVIAVGDLVGSVTVGQPVSIETHLSCGSCDQCRANRRHTCRNLRLFSKLGIGGFCDYAVVPEIAIRGVDPTLPYPLISVLEPLGIGLRLAMEGNVSGRSVLVCGCGPIGLFAIAAARALGAMTIVATDIEAERLVLAKSTGADITIDVSRTAALRALKDAEAPTLDLAIDASGSPIAITDALTLLSPGGRLLMAGLPDAPLSLDVATLLIAKELRMQGVYGRLIDETWLAAERLLRTRRLTVEPILTHRFPLADFDEAFRLAASCTAGKVLFELSDS
jgi:threonine 3-dehydrogenase